MQCIRTIICGQQAGKSQNHPAMGTGTAFRKFLRNIMDPVPDTVFGVRHKLSFLPYVWRKKYQSSNLQAGHLDAATNLDFIKLESGFI